MYIYTYMIWSSSFLYWSKQLNSNSSKLNIRDNNLLATKVAIDSFFRTEFAADSKKNSWYNYDAEGAFQRCKNVPWPICMNLTMSKWPPQGSCGDLTQDFWDFSPLMYKEKIWHPFSVSWKPLWKPEIHLAFLEIHIRNLKST